ncbi:MAG: hypothetical protein D6781_07490 [Verrucomicrobia bacterium]|nr:MAG: hypothetical protein D6781_07490 [Verrucomicrobiota bacterium]
MNFDTTHWHTEKILRPRCAATLARRLREQGRKIITTNGSFDLLHAGHLDQLEEARGLGDVLFVGLNTDRPIRAAKGPGRPVIPAPARAALLAALACVDYVVLMSGTYEEEPMRSLLIPVRPHIHVNGPDYGPPRRWREYPLMRELGIRGHTVRRRNDFSTTAIIERLLSRHGGRSASSE